MKIEKIKPIPQYILKAIQKRDKKACPNPESRSRFYSYFTKNDGELVKVTVAVRHKKKEWYAKQCAVHGIHSKYCFVRDMHFSIFGGYTVGWYREGLKRTEAWYEQGKEWWESYDKYFDPYAPCVNKDYVQSLAAYRYSALDLYTYVDILRYLRTYEAHPVVEYFVKLGLLRFAKSVLLIRRAEKDKDFRKWIAKNRAELSQKHFDVAVILEAYQKKASLSERQKIAERKKEFTHRKDTKEVRLLFAIRSEKALYTYLARQNVGVSDYMDYIKACQFLGLDLTEEKHLLPHDFRHWHDIRIDEYHSKRAEIDARKRKELYDRFASVAEKYIKMQHSKSTGFVAIIAKSPAELIREGETLGHCVGRMGYDQKFAREETLIFFIRDKHAPDVPLVTVEYSPSQKKVLQCYAKGNKTPTEAIQDYVRKIWLPYANRQLRKIA